MGGSYHIPQEPQISAVTKHTLERVQRGLKRRYHLPEQAIAGLEHVLTYFGKRWGELQLLPDWSSNRPLAGVYARKELDQSAPLACWSFCGHQPTQFIYGAGVFDGKHPGVLIGIGDVTCGTIARVRITSERNAFEAEPDALCALQAASLAQYASSDHLLSALIHEAVAVRSDLYRIRTHK